MTAEAVANLFPCVQVAFAARLEAMSEGRTNAAAEEVNHVSMSAFMGRSQNLKQTVDVVPIIVKMGRYSYGISPDAHKNLSLLK